LSDLIEGFSDNYIRDCEYDPDDRQRYDRSPYTGIIDFYTKCGGESTVVVVVAAVREGAPFIILLSVQAVNEADIEAMDKIISSFKVVGDLPRGD